MPDLHTIELFCAALGVGATCGVAILLAMGAMLGLARPTFEDFIEGHDR